MAHIYLNDLSLESKVRAVLESEPGVSLVLDRSAQKQQGINHRRSGALIAVAGPQSWFTYYYWEEDAVAPDFARTVDIHRKIGYDPAELFIDPKLRWPHLHVAAFLLRKKLGLRGLLSVIPLDATLVRGSHGRCPEDENDWPVLMMEKHHALANTGTSLEATAVHDELLRYVNPAP